METRTPQIVMHGPVAEHDQACAVYTDEPAVFDMNRSVFEPSWKARKNGWRLVKASTALQRIAIRLLFKEQK